MECLEGGVPTGPSAQTADETKSLLMIELKRFHVKSLPRNPYIQTGSQLVQSAEYSAATVQPAEHSAATVQPSEHSAAIVQPTEHNEGSWRFDVCLLDYFLGQPSDSKGLLSRRFEPWSRLRPYQPG